MPVAKLETAEERIRPALARDGWILREGTPANLPRPVQIGCGLVLLAMSLLNLAGAVALARWQGLRWPAGALVLVLFVLSGWATVRSLQLTAGRRHGDRGSLLSSLEIRLFLVVWGAMILTGVLRHVLERLQPGWTLALIVLPLTAAWAMLLWRQPLRSNAISYWAQPGPDLLRTASPQQRLPVFKPFERQVLEIVLGESDAHRHLVPVLDEMEPLALLWERSGYVLSVTHPAIALDDLDVVWDQHLRGVAEGVECEFYVQIENSLRLECHIADAGRTNGVLPEDFRRREVRVQDAAVRRARRYVSWDRDEIKGLPAAWSRVLTEVDHTGRVLREIALDAENRVLHRAPSASDNYGMFDLVPIDGSVASDLTRETFERLWESAEDPSS